MYNTQSSARNGFAGVTALIMSVALMLGVFAAPATSQASAAYQTDQVKVTSIPANGTVTLKARGFCTDFGKPFPAQQSMTANGLAPDNMRGALNYAVQKGYAAGNAQQVQLAVWYLKDNTWHNQDNTVAQEIVSNTTGTLPTANAVALTDALAQNSVTISANFVPQTADAFYGDGDVVVTNTTSSALNVYMPVGVMFTVPNSNGQYQDLVAYELAQAEGTPTAGATTTAAATGTAEATGTVSVTGTAEATATGAATGTAVATVTSAATGTVEATATGAATAEATSTTAVSTPVETATSVAVATTVPTVEATATTVPVTAPLPQTGGGSTDTIVLLVVAMGLAMAGMGMLMRSRKA
ncbi:MAG: hypothetical protein ABI670_09885 [Chloroflexota bacterium]